MEDMQSQMNAILGNPDMMQKIMEMANALKAPQENAPPPQDAPPVQQDNSGFSLPDIDLSMVQKLSGIVGKTGIDHNQRTLLSALRPYLSYDRIAKLEKAMRAAKLANLASNFLGNERFQLNLGR